MGQSSKARVAFVDDEQNLAESLKAKFSLKYDAVAFTSPLEALEQIDSSFAVVVSDQRMPKMTGAELLTKLRKKTPETILILLTAAQEKDIAEIFPRLINEARIFQFIPKQPLFPEHMVHVLADAVELFTRRREERKQVALLAQDAKKFKAIVRTRTSEERTFEDFIGDDPRLQNAINLGKFATQQEGLTVLITGESGTGKDIMARAIHYQGPRRSKPFVSANCAVFDKSLIRSELFGHEKGAFTGADSASLGLIRKAEGGTIFLDEFGELPKEVQAALLKFIEDRYVEPVGRSSSRNIRVDVRIIVATNRDLDEEVRQGRFRLDLFQRLQEHPIHMPPLRERHGDFEQLIQHALLVAASRLGLDEVPISPAAIRQLERLPYPGNVRELYNTIFRLVKVMMMSGHTIVDANTLKEVLKNPQPIRDTPLTLAEAETEFRKEFIQRALLRNTSQLAAAKELDMSTRNLRDLIAKYGLAEEA